jgi:hypothetical protein
MGAKNSVSKVLCPVKKKEDYIRLFPRDKDFKLYDAATDEYQKITGNKKNKMTKEQFLKSQAERFVGMDPHLLESIWNAFDCDGNGFMDRDEFRLYRAINGVGSRRQRAIALFAVTDTSNDRVLQKSEIVSMMILARKFAKRSQMAEPPAAPIELTPEEVVDITSQADAFLAAHDKDGNQLIEFEEFLKGWQDAAFADFNFFDDKDAPNTSYPTQEEVVEKEKQKEKKEEQKVSDEPAADAAAAPAPAEEEKDGEKKKKHHHHHKKEKKEEEK